MKSGGSREAWVQRWWDGRTGVAGMALSLLTLPLAGIYRAGVALRAIAYDRGLLSTHGVAIPVISVGNLVVGGAGKTPVASWLVQRLHQRGLLAAVLLRGYGSDEVLLHRRWTPNARVIPGADRVRTAGEAVERGATVAVLDDGFQHRRVARALDLVLVAAEHPFPGRLLPRGPYREPVSALARADLVIVTRRTAGDRTVERLLGHLAQAAPGKTGPLLRLAPSGWTTLDGESAEDPRGPLLAATSVAGPGHFAQVVRRLTGEQVTLRTYPDHHEFDRNDANEILREAAGRTVVTTEKDAVKLAPLGALPPASRVLTLAVELERGGDIIERALDGVFGTSTPLTEAERAGRRRGAPHRGGGEEQAER